MVRSLDQRLNLLEILQRWGPGGRVLKGQVMKRW